MPPSPSSAQLRTLQPSSERFLPAKRNTNSLRALVCGISPTANDSGSGRRNRRYHVQPQMKLTLPTGATARLLVVTCMAALLPVVASAQPARPQNPPDLAGEWSLANNEYDTTAQPPLG